MKRSRMHCCWSVGGTDGHKTTTADPNLVQLNPHALARQLMGPSRDLSSTFSPSFMAILALLL